VHAWIETNHTLLEPWVDDSSLPNDILTLHHQRPGAIEKFMVLSAIAEQGEPDD
jgi:hypothetical protein